jgi:hypothetical protein
MLRLIFQTRTGGIADSPHPANPLVEQFGENASAPSSASACRICERRYSPLFFHSSASARTPSATVVTNMQGFIYGPEGQNWLVT